MASKAKAAVRRAYAKMRSLKRRERIIVMLLGVALIATATGPMWYPYIAGQWAASVSGGGATTFSVTVRAPLTPSVDVGYYGTWTATLRGHVPGTPDSSPSSWQTISGVSRPADITRSVVETALRTYDKLYVTISGTCVNSKYTFNDPYGDRTYYARE
ncbi:MAG: hypothetical protein Q6373_004540, partial [Candidatus Sigynarchaeota archaeon]